MLFHNTHICVNKRIFACKFLYRKNILLVCSEQIFGNSFTLYRISYNKSRNIATVCRYRTVSPCSDKKTTFDLFCTSEAGEQFIVEMQFAEQETYRERMLFYATYPLRAQMDARIRAVERLSGITRDRMDYSLHPVYVLSMLNFSLPHEGDKALEEGLVSRFSIRNDGNGEIMTDALHFIYLELGRLGRKKGEEALCRTPLERLAYSLKYMHMLDDRPEGFDDDLQQMLFTATELAGMTQEQRQEYDKTMTTKIDIIEQQETARKRGLEEGMEKGRLEGLLDVAGKMRAEGLPAELICRMTGLSPEQVKAL